MKVKNMLFPGDEWLYYRIYTNVITADEVLDSLYRCLMRNGFGDSFFFIRYSDPDFHLRVRLRVEDGETLLKAARTMRRWTEMTKRHKQVWKVEIGTYERETERYSLLPMPLTEQHFCRESKAVCKALQAEIEPYKITLSMINRYLTCLGLDYMEMASCMRKMAEAYFPEFSVGKDEVIALNGKYRELKSHIEGVLKGGDNDADSTAIRSGFSSTPDEEAAFFDTLKRKRGDNRFLPYLMSLTHMLCDRIFTDYNRMQEMAAYYYFSKFYTSEHYKAQSESRK